MELKVVQYGVAADGVATVRLHRPGRGNSWTKRMNQEYRWVMAEAERDPAVRVIVLTGTGQQFCVGADMKALDTYTDGRTDYVESLQGDEFATPGYGVHPEFDHDVIWQWGIRKPIICAVNGACAGMGLALAAFSDLRYAVEGAKFTTATARLGMPAEYGLAWLLPKMLGLTNAADILITGRVFLAEEAHRMGLLNGVFAQPEFETKIAAIASGMATTVSPLAAAATKLQMYGELMTLQGGQAIEASKALIGAMMKAPDFAEGVAAHQQRRAPKFGSSRPGGAGFPSRQRVAALYGLTARASASGESRPSTASRSQCPAPLQAFTFARSTSRFVAERGKSSTKAMERGTLNGRGSPGTSLSAPSRRVASLPG